jgi:hypothetical protein
LSATPADRDTRTAFDGIADGVETSGLCSESAVELAFLGHPLEGFFGTLDAILVVIAFGGKQLHDPIRTICGHVADRPRRKIDGLANLKFVLFQL